MMIPFADESSAAGVSLARTSAYTPRSRTFRAIRWQYCPPASRTIICAVGFNFRCYQVAQSGTEQQSRSQMKSLLSKTAENSPFWARYALHFEHGPVSAAEEVSVVVTILSKTDRKPTLGGKCLEEWQQWPFTGLGGESQAARARPPGFFPCPKGRRLKAVLDKSDLLQRGHEWCSGRGQADPEGIPARPTLRIEAGFGGFGGGWRQVVGNRR